MATLNRNQLIELQHWVSVYLGKDYQMTYIQLQQRALFAQVRNTIPVDAGADHNDYDAVAVYLRTHTPSYLEAERERIERERIEQERIDQERIEQDRQRQGHEDRELFQTTQRENERLRQHIRDTERENENMKQQLIATRQELRASREQREADTELFKRMRQENDTLKRKQQELKDEKERILRERQHITSIMNIPASNTHRHHIKNAFGCGMKSYKRQKEVYWMV